MLRARLGAMKRHYPLFCYGEHPPVEPSCPNRVFERFVWEMSFEWCRRCHVCGDWWVENEEDYW